MTDQTLDATGLKCPMPVLRTRRMLESMAIGDTLKLIADDQTSVTDVPAFCRMAGHHLQHVDDQNGRIIFIIEKDGQQPSKEDHSAQRITIGS